MTTPFTFSSVPGGAFTMGSRATEEGHTVHEGPLHRVAVKPFQIASHLVSQRQWERVAAMPVVSRLLDPYPARFTGADLPVDSISWRDAMEFCNRLTVFSGRTCRLPSEAEWEYACRAGTTTAFHFGDTMSSEVATFDASRTTPVEHYQGIMNPWGLYDVHGNLYEWCWDYWHHNYEGAPTDGSPWLWKAHDHLRVIRGGSWALGSEHCRSASRCYHHETLASDRIGFRFVMVP